MTASIQVATGVVRDHRGHILVTRRPEGTHLAGRWEFPGGKLQAGETGIAALGRELAEELDIEVRSARPLIGVCHRYPEVVVDLQAYEVLEYRGQPRGAEGQETLWVSPTELEHYPHPEANRPVFKACRLPRLAAVTPAEVSLDNLEQLLDRLPPGSPPLVQLRAPKLKGEAFKRCAQRALALAQARQLPLVLNCDPALALELGAPGVHLTSARLATNHRRPVPRDICLGASCHNAEELTRAAAMDADYALLGPVASTPSHPGAEGLGWAHFARLVAGAGLPVYAIGGLRRERDLERACHLGAQGIAGISDWW